MEEEKQGRSKRKGGVQQEKGQGGGLVRKMRRQGSTSQGDRGKAGLEEKGVDTCLSRGPLYILPDSGSGSVKCNSSLPPLGGDLKRAVKSLISTERLAQKWMRGQWGGGPLEGEEDFWIKELSLAGSQLPRLGHAGLNTRPLPSPLTFLTFCLLGNNYPARCNVVSLIHLEWKLQEGRDNGLFCSLLQPQCLHQHGEMLQSKRTY